ncbi:hypothetical protein [Bradyrhizobium sp. LB11.1]|uniref:hypothetical protein n=1 Tax=Bradyrhizobium sp. LB11.1 TaxID=3156326 RepID=UPI0033979573
MVDDKPKPRTAEPASLLSQWWTMGRIAADRRTTGRHMKAGWVIINSYWQKHGNGRASLSYIQQATGLDRKAAVKACRELDEWGHATRVPGTGTRPSEYVPHWVTSASGVQTTTTNDDAPSGVQTTTPLVVESTPLDDASGVQTTTQTYLRTPAYRPAVQEVESSSDGAATPPPPGDGLAATPAGETPPGARATVPNSQAGGFDELWAAYGFKHDRAKAKAAYGKLDPSPELHAELCAGAAAWADHYETNNTEPRWRVRLHNWIGGEKYLEDVPQVYTDAKSAAISKVRGSARPVSQKSAERAKPRPPAAPITARVGSSAIVKVGNGSELRFTATDANGVEHERAIVLEHDDMETQFAGQKLFAGLVRAAGLEQVEDSSELHGRTIVITGDGFIAPTTRPDDEPPLPVKPEPVRYANPPPSKPMTEAEIEALRARIAAFPPMPRRKDFTITDEEREAWTADEDDDGDWPDDVDDAA